MSPPMIFIPLRPSRIESSSRVDHPPTSEVPVAIDRGQLQDPEKFASMHDNQLPSSEEIGRFESFNASSVAAANASSQVWFQDLLR